MFELLGKPHTLQRIKGRQGLKCCVNVQGPLQSVGWGSAATPPNAAELPEDPEAVAQAHANTVTGACLSIGVRYAGTADPQAQATLTRYVEKFLRAKMDAPDPFSGSLLPALECS